MGSVLRVNLETEKITKEALPTERQKKFLGGVGLGIKYLYDEVGPETAPLEAKNKLIFFTGPVTGTPIPTSARTALVTKSPLTGAFTHSTVGGHLGPAFKFAGYDGLIIEGAAEKPVYLYINNDTVELKSAEDLWGEDCYTTEDKLKDLHDEPELHLASIGLGGEKLSTIANIKTDYYRSFGRGGGGAVMGSKKLKTIAIKGDKYDITAPDVDALLDLSKSLLKEITDKVGPLREYGTMAMAETTNAQGVLPTKNFQKGTFNGIEGISTERMKNLKIRNRSCYGCPIGCGQYIELEKGKYKGENVEGPEYETLFAFGSYLENDDIETIAKANILCDEYGIDTISTGVSIGFAMECFQRGIITTEDTNGLKLEWGNSDVIIELTEKIAKREGIGAILADGVRKAAKRIGNGAEKFAMHTKGLEFPGYDPRGLQGSGLGFATSNRGACHTSHYVLDPELGGKVERFSTEGKAKLTKYLQDLMTIFDSLLMCKFLHHLLPLKFETYIPVLNVVTGWEMDVDDLAEIGERIFNLERMFNVREGIRRKDDTLPERFLENPLEEGPSKGHTVKLHEMLEEYYEVRQWRESGIPEEEKLNELGLHSAAQDVDELE